MLIQFSPNIQLVEETECLFPHIKEKGLKLQLYHYNELAGKVIIDGDMDAVEALNNFIQESLNERRPKYMILHAEDIIPPFARTKDTIAKKRATCPNLSCLPSLEIAITTTALQSYGLLGSR